MSCQVNDGEQWTGARQWQDCPVTEANLTSKLCMHSCSHLSGRAFDDLKVDCKEWAARFGYEYIVRTSSDSQVCFVCSHQANQGSAQQLNNRAAEYAVQLEEDWLRLCHQILSG